MSEWDYCKNMYVTRNFDEHTVMKNVIEKNDVNLIMEEVKSALDTNQVEWQADRHGYRSTVDIPIVYNPELNLGGNPKLPSTVRVTNQILKEKISKQFEDMYGFDKEDISYQEAFLIRYTPDTQDHLAPHQDGSPISFVCALNDKSEYKGGGTHFVEKDETCTLENAGDCCVFSGQQEHEGLPVTGGERLVLAGFVNYGPSEDACNRIVSRNAFVNHKYRDEFAKTKSCSGCIENGGINSLCPEECVQVIENAVSETKKDLLYSEILPRIMESEDIQEVMEKSNNGGKNFNFRVLNYIESLPIMDDPHIKKDIYTLIEHHEPGVQKSQILHTDNPILKTIQDQTAENLET